MAFRKPLVLDDVAVKEQLQAGDDLDIPLNQQVDELRHKLNVLASYLIMQGVELPDELTSEL